MSPAEQRLRATGLGAGVVCALGCLCGSSVAGRAGGDSMLGAASALRTGSDSAATPRH